MKEKRDFFIHRLFRQGEWPGDLDAEDCMIMVRRLVYLQIVFQRAAIRIWKVLARAGLIMLHDLGESGWLMENYDLFEDNEVSEDAG